MPLTAEELADVRTEISDNDPPSDADLDAIFLRRGSVQGTILEVLRKRLAAYLADPAQFIIPGEYGQNVAENIKSLERQIARVSAGSYGVAAALVRIGTVDRADPTR